MTDTPHAGAPRTEPAQVGLLRALAEAGQHLDDLRRVQAEFENYRKRVLREQTTTVDRANAALLEAILPVLDDFDLALMAAERTKDYALMVKGVELVYAKLRETLEKAGLERIDAAGKPFDPEQHEAVMRSDDGDGDGDGEEPFVADEFRAGYRYAGRVLRPAMVKVGKR